MATHGAYSMGETVVLLGNAAAFNEPVPLPAKGSGYLAGEFPGGITTVDGAPTASTVRVLYRPVPGAPGDGAVVAEVQSAPDGTWRIDGLDTGLRYDVVGRKDGFNDVIVANVSPVIDEP